jgi:hypothetical protein
MFFIWGSKRTKTILGYVADWCGRCQSATAGALVELRKASHAYFVPLGRGHVLGHEFVCGRCSAPASTLASRYASVAYAPNAPFQELLAYTNPSLQAALQRGRTADAPSAR